MYVATPQAVHVSQQIEAHTHTHTHTHIAVLGHTSPLQIAILAMRFCTAVAAVIAATATCVAAAAVAAPDAIVLPRDCSARCRIAYDRIRGVQYGTLFDCDGNYLASCTDTACKISTCVGHGR